MTVEAVEIRTRTPNFQFRSWREREQMTRADLAAAINQSPTGRDRRLFCDEERIRRWEAGEVLWPSADYRKALYEVTGHDPDGLGFRPRPAAPGRTTPLVPTGSLRDELESRHHLLTQDISKLQAELDYLTAVLAIPVPGIIG